MLCMNTDELKYLIRLIECNINGLKQAIRFSSGENKKNYENELKIGIKILSDLKTQLNSFYKMGLE